MSVETSTDVICGWIENDIEIQSTYFLSIYGKAMILVLEAYYCP